MIKTYLALIPIFIAAVTLSTAAVAFEKCSGKPLPVGTQVGILVIKDYYNYADPTEVYEIDSTSSELYAYEIFTGPIYSIKVSDDNLAATVTYFDSEARQCTERTVNIFSAEGGGVPVSEG